MSTGRSAEDFEADKLFEADVLRIARLIYPGISGGATMLDGRERDGVLVGNEVAVAIEATRSRSLSKAETDAKKLKQATDALARAHPTKAIRGFFVTADEPLAQQRDAVKRFGGPLVTAISLAALRRQLFDAESYMAARDDYPFGSARDPLSDNYRVTTPYVALDLVEVGSNRSWSVEDVVAAIQGGERIILTGEFGVGKSMTLREVFQRLRSLQRVGSALPPIHLNLRNHQGQDDPSEALHRHADRIGFAEPAQLVRAWRAGETSLILDGFDEITFPGFSGRATGWKDVRRRNVALVRKFLNETPARSGVLIAGRSYFFDSTVEMARALGIPPSAHHLSASDFTERQVKEFLRSQKLEAKLPDWLPSRPLILGYLAANGFLDEAEVQSSSDAAAGWHLLLDMICAREAQIELGLDGPLIRRIIERLATRARRTSSGRGPLRFDDLDSAFRDICGYQPDEGSRVVLDRLPGLGVGNEPATDLTDLPREFIDAEFADAARAGDVYEFIMAPTAFVASAGEFRDWDSLLEDVGMEVVRHRLEMVGLNGVAVAAALRAATSIGDETGLTIELLRLLLALGGALSGPAPLVRDVVIPSLTIAKDADAGNAAIQDSIIERVDLEEGYTDKCVPRLLRCSIGIVEGATSEADFAPTKVEECTVDTFADSAATTASIMDLAVPDEVKVRLSILKKIYLQRGSGRKESALVRGLRPKDRALVPGALALLHAEGLVVRSRAGKTVLWVPVRSAHKRALQILGAPLSSRDPVVIT